MSGLRLGKRRDRAAFKPVVMPSLDVAKGTEEFDTRTQRAIEDLADAVNDLGGGESFVADVDLIVGTNTINHGLGRTPTLVQVSPKTADVFRWGWNPDQPGNPKPTSIVQITVAGGAMTARVVVE